MVIRNDYSSSSVRIGIAALLTNILLTVATAEAQNSRPALAVTEELKNTPAIQDNSFLVEEAYNQDRGVVQHINTFRMDRGSRAFDYVFTQEWPVGGQANQLSYDLPIVRGETRADGTGLGDMRLNYRYQLIGGDESRVAVSPRLSVDFPTGDWRRSRGSGSPALETMIPASVVVNQYLVTHFNAGVTFAPHTRNTSGDRAATNAVTLAGSAIMTANPNVQLMLETVWENGSDVVGPRLTERNTSFVVSPGVRGALNFASGLQIVPGLAFPIGVGPSGGERGIFVYLSFEHPFTKKAQ